MINNKQQRYQELLNWLKSALNTEVFECNLLAGDASFRRYYRIRIGNETYVLMDAPPEKESCQPFSAIAKAFQARGLSVPHIYAEDLERGFLLLSDFGDVLYSHCLNPETAHELYEKALDDLLPIHQSEQIENYAL